MARTHHSKIGIGALVAYAVITVVTAIMLLELGSKPLGYSSLTSMLIAGSAEERAAAQRYGKLWIRSDHLGHCREYSLDNKTQQIAMAGTVVCDREQYARTNQRSRAEIIRDAFRGK